MILCPTLELCSNDIVRYYVVSKDYYSSTLIDASSQSDG
jgi:hypothetical protein